MRRASLALAGFLAFNLPWVRLRRRRRGGGKGGEGGISLHV